MKTLQVIRLKPNPPGKDRTRFGRVTAAQLAGEWVDFKNNGRQAVDLQNVELYHIAYDDAGKRHWMKIQSFSGPLQPGSVVRVHSGSGEDKSVIRPEDRDGADHHVFTGADAYVWNNDRPDTAGLWDPTSKTWIDNASYEPQPPEGIVLVRVGDHLVAGAL